MSMSYEQACDRAKAESKEHQCLQHVNAQCALVKDIPTIIHFTVSDWYSSEATIRSYFNGQDHSI